MTTTMKKKNSYQDIKTLDELHAAIRHNRARIEAKGEKVSTSLTQVRGFYTPQNLALQAVKKYAFDHRFYTIAINAVVGLKNLLKK